MIQRAFVFLALIPAGAAGQTVNDFLDDKVLQRLDITINPKDWQTLQANYQANTYYPANFKWRNITVENVGIRSKGRTSRRAVKPGLRVDTNRFEDGQEFLGLKSFLLDNTIQDYTFIKERLVFRIFEMMGLPAPKETNARLYVNGEYIGLYSLLESTDKRFLKDRYGEDDGYLYEYQTPPEFRFEYRGADPALYSPINFKPETHELDPNPRPIEAMVRAVNQSSDADFVRVVSEFLDLRRFLTHLAIEAYVAEYDGIVSDAGMNNFLFYRFVGKNLGAFIPKDRDLSFQLVDYSMLKNIDRNVLTRRCMAVPELKAHFVSETLRVGRLISGQGGWMHTEIDRIYPLIRDAAYEDKNKECLGSPPVCTLEQTNLDFERALEYLKRFAVERTDAVMREFTLAGYPLPSQATPTIVQGGAVNAAPNGGAIVAPGSLVTLYGLNLANSALQTAAPWPTIAAGGQVLINGTAAPIYYASPGQMNFQLPWEAPAGTVSLQAVRDGLRSATITLPVASTSPGIFNVTNQDGSPVLPATPAAAGAVITLWANGLGDVTNRPATGAPALASPLSATRELPTVTIGGVNATVLFSGLAPGFVGLYQVNAVVPATVSTGTAPLVIAIGGRASPAFSLALR
jgi:uncharacterized protein (TIGR03437 family)